MCGEKRWTEHHPSRGLGSPPRVLGKVYRCKHIVRWLGITPACAGKRYQIATSGKNAEDHPRVCGEKSNIVLGRLPIAGSPPRVRGKVCAESMVVPPAGITPACAGKSRFGLRASVCAEDHPRVCGEKRWLVWHSAEIRGSPPRVRGKGIEDQLEVGTLGITPACAGKRKAGYGGNA